MSYKPVPLASRWLSWPFRTSAASITYAPGQPEFTEEGFNAWTGWGCAARKGDVSLFHKLLDHFFPNDAESKAARKWLVQWLAYPIQHPGCKLYTAVLLWSRLHGTGKTMLGYMMRNIYGAANFAEIKQRQLHGRFNRWAQNKQFVLADDITGTDKREVADELKTLVTQETIWIDVKNIPEFELPNRCNFLITSNRPTALYLEDDDRRFFVWEVRSKADPKLFHALDEWYRSTEGQEALHYYLKHVDLTGFDPTAAAPTTEAKEVMQDVGATDHARWCRRLSQNPDTYLRLGKVPRVGDLFTSQELLRLFEQEGPTLVKAGGLASELKAAGFEQTPLLRWGSPERRDRFFIIRNADRWAKASTRELRKHVEASRAGGR